MASLLKFAAACAACAVAYGAEHVIKTPETTELVSLPSPSEYIESEIADQEKEMCSRIATDFINIVNFHGLPVSVVNSCNVDQRRMLINVLTRLNVIGRHITTSDHFRTFLNSRTNLLILMGSMARDMVVRQLALSDLDIARMIFTKAVVDAEMRNLLVNVLRNQDVARNVVSVLFGDAQIRNVVLQDLNLRHMLIRNFLVRSGVINPDFNLKQFYDVAYYQPTAIKAVVRVMLNEPVLKTLISHDVDLLRTIAYHMQKHTGIRNLCFRDVNFIRSLVSRSIHHHQLKRIVMTVFTQPDTFRFVRTYFVSNPSFRALCLGNQHFRRFMIRNLLVESNLLDSEFSVDEIRAFMTTNPTRVLTVLTLMPKDNVLRSLVFTDMDLVRSIYTHAMQNSQIRAAFLTALRDAQVLQTINQFLVNEPKIRTMIIQDSRIADLLKTIDTTMKVDDVMRAQVRSRCQKYTKFFTRSIDLGKLKLRIIDNC